MSTSVSAGAGSSGAADASVGTSTKAPLALMTQFLAEISKENFDVAIKLAEEVLAVEPTNATVKEYIPVLHQMKALRAAEAKAEEGEDEEGNSKEPEGEGEEDSEEDDESDDEEDDSEEDEDEEDVDDAAQPK